MVHIFELLSQYSFIFLNSEITINWSRLRSSTSGMVWLKKMVSQMEKSDAGLIPAEDHLT